MISHLGRFIMISDFTEEELLDFHNKESKYKYSDNLYAVSMGKLWKKYADGFYDKDIKSAERQRRNREFEEHLDRLIWQNGVFDHLEKIYRGYEGENYDKKFMYMRCKESCNWPINVVQRVDRLIVENRLTVERGLVDKLSNKANVF